MYEGQKISIPDEIYRRKSAFDFLSTSTNKMFQKNSQNKEVDENSKQISVIIDKGDELQTSFVHLLSKYILNTHEIKFNDYFLEHSSIKYQQLYDYLKNCHKKCGRENGHLTKNLQSQKGTDLSYEKKSKRKGSSMDEYNFQFNFECSSNHIIILLDLSPYMLIYDYSTKSFPLKNMQLILKNLMKGLKSYSALKMKNGIKKEYSISFYAFSVYSQQIQAILTTQVEMQSEERSNKEAILSYVISYICKSKLPHEEKGSSSIGSIIQNVLNQQEGKTGIQTFITISTFKENEIEPRVFISANWYTFAFICTGDLNFGSYKIDVEEIKSRYKSNSYFKTKFVCTVKLLQNWEKAQLISTNALDNSPIKNEKGRSVVYYYENSPYHNIFPLLLKFSLKKKQRKSIIEGIRSNQSTANTGFRHIHKEYRISQDNIPNIVKLKYQQGWEQMPIDNLLENSKYVFKLRFSKNRSLCYRATKSGDNFNVEIFPNEQSMSLNFIMTELSNKKTELVEEIEKIDLINSIDFDIIDIIKANREKNKLGHFNRKHKEIIEYIYENHEGWEKFAKVRKIYLKLAPKFNKIIFKELLAELNFFIGEKLPNSNWCFINRKYEKIKQESQFNGKQKSQIKLTLTRIGKRQNFLELKLGFLKYRESEIEVNIQNIRNKLENRKFKSGLVSIIPEELFFYSGNWQVNFPFVQVWDIKLSNPKIFSAYRFYFQSLLTKKMFIPLENKNYYKIIIYKENGKEKRKPIFLQIYEKVIEATIQYKLSTLPSFAKADFQSESEDFSIPISALFCNICDEVRNSQVKILSMMENYILMHEALVLTKITDKKFDDNFPKKESLLYKKIKVIYSSEESWNPRKLFQSCQELYQKTQIDEMQGRIKELKKRINIEQIPLPTKKLLSSSIQKINGDFELYSKCGSYSYTFFLFLPFIPVYTLIKEGKVYIKFVVMAYEETRADERKQEVQELIRNELISEIEKQECRQKYTNFFNMIKEGRDEKSIEMEKNYGEQFIDVACVFQAIKRKKEDFLNRRIRECLDKLSVNFFQLIKIFYLKSQAQNFYYERSWEENNEEINLLKEKYQIQDEKEEQFEQLMMRIYFEEGEGVKNLTEENFKDFFSQCESQKPKRIKVILYKGYGVQFSKKQERIIKIMNEFIREAAVYLKIITITQETQILPISKQISERYFSKRPKLNLIQLFGEKETENIEKICLHVESLTMKNIIKFQKCKTIDKYISCEEEEQCCPNSLSGDSASNNVLKLKNWITLQVTEESLITSYIDLKYIKVENSNETQLSTQIDQYLMDLQKYVKTSELIREMSKSQKLPVSSECQLFINDSVNDRIWKALKEETDLNKKKKPAKLHVPKKYIAKLKPKQEKSKGFEEGQKEEVTRIKYPIQQLYEETFVPNYDRIKTKEGFCLEAIAKQQNFGISTLANAPNVYTFDSLIQKETFLVYFQEVPFEKVNTELKKSLAGFDDLKIVLVYHVYCFSLNMVIKKGDVEKIIFPWIKEAFSSAIFKYMSEKLSKSPHLIEEPEYELLKMEKQKKVTRKKLPFISERYNFKQYLRQHLEVYHSRTQIQNVKGGKKQQMVKKVEEEQGKQFQNENQNQNGEDRNERRSTKERRDSQKQKIIQLEEKKQEEENECRCVPSMWIFNHNVNDKLATKFGKCIYLLKVDIDHSFDTVDNCYIWERKYEENLVKKYIYPHDETEENRKKIQLHLQNPKKSEEQMKESEKTIVTFTITNYVGSPIFSTIQEYFSHMIKFALYDYRLQSSLFYNLIEIGKPFSLIYHREYGEEIKKKNPKKSLQSKNSISEQTDLTLSLRLQKTESSPGKAKKLFSSDSEPIKQKIENELYHQIHRWCNSIKNTVTIQGEGVSLASYKTTCNLFIEDIELYAYNFLEKFISAIDQKKYEYSLPFVMYGCSNSSEEKHHYWVLEYDSKAEFSGSIGKRIIEIQNENRMKSVQYSKIGFFTFDSLAEINEMVKEKGTMEGDTSPKLTEKFIEENMFPISHQRQFKSGHSQMNELAWMKIFNDDKSFCQNSYLFKRSLFMHYTITKQSFSYFSYNFNKKFISELKDYFFSIESWLSEKNRLLKFIEKAKETEGNYPMIPPKQTIQPEKQSFMKILFNSKEVKRLDDIKKQKKEGQNNTHITMSSLLKSIVFDDLPLQSWKREGKKVEEMYQALSNKVVPFKKYPQYNGKEKTKLERIGKEYLSIIRSEYGHEKIKKNRKHSKNSSQ